uniref:FGENESH: predicted gene_5.490 protein n=1 Tax=Rhodotorula toruloides TaxID=5286 RepID=A0A0K3CBF6_RHOTO
MTVASGGDEAYQPFEEAMRASICRVFQRRTSDFRQRLFEEVRAAQLRHSLSPPAPPSPESPATGRPKQFTAEVLAILEAAFEASDSVSRGERRELANVTGLTERQVLTWRRTVSGSSLGSSGSSLVEYAEQDLVLPPLDPSVQQPLFLPDVPVLGDVTAPTPIAATFFATPSSSRFDCSASSVSSSLDDFSIPQPPRAAYDPSSLFSTSPSNASTSSFDLPPLDAPFEPAIVQAPAPTDAWMDDEFYRNLFGSLGLDAELEGMQGVEADLSFLF